MKVLCEEDTSGYSLSVGNKTERKASSNLTVAMQKNNGEEYVASVTHYNIPNMGRKEKETPVINGISGQSLSFAFLIWPNAM